MNGYECNGTDISMKSNIECSIQRGDDMKISVPSHE